MRRRTLKKLQENFYKEQEKIRKEERDQINLREEVFTPIRKLISKILKPIFHSRYKRFFLILVGIVFLMFGGFRFLIFFNDSKEAMQPDDNKPFQESVVEIKNYLIRENKNLIEEVKKEKATADEYKVKYEEEKKEKEDIQAKYEALQMEVKSKQQ